MYFAFLVWLITIEFWAKAQNLTLDVAIQDSQANIDITLEIDRIFQPAENRSSLQLHDHKTQTKPAQNISSTQPHHHRVQSHTNLSSKPAQRCQKPSMTTGDQSYGFPNGVTAVNLYTSTFCSACNHTRVAPFQLTSQSTNFGPLATNTALGFSGIGSQTTVEYSYRLFFIISLFHTNLYVWW